MRGRDMITFRRLNFVKIRPYTCLDRINVKTYREHDESLAPYVRSWPLQIGLVLEYRNNGRRHGKRREEDRNEASNPRDIVQAWQRKEGHRCTQYNGSLTTRKVGCYQKGKDSGLTTKQVHAPMTRVGVAWRRPLSSSILDESRVRSKNM